MNGYSFKFNFFMTSPQAPLQRREELKCKVKTLTVLSIVIDYTNFIFATNLLIIFIIFNNVLYVH